MAFYLAQIFRKHRDAAALRKGAQALMEALKTDDSSAILALLRQSPALLDAHLEFVPGQTERITAFEFLLRTSREKTAAVVAAAWPQVLTNTDGDGNTLTLRCFRSGAYDRALPLLHDLDSAMGAANKDGDTRLHIAARRREEHTAITTFALKNNPHINAVNNKLQTPLMIAAAYGSKHEVEALVGAGADIHAVDGNGLNAVMLAMRHSELNNATLLMEKGARVDFSDPAVETQMRVATSEMNLAFLQALEARRKEQATEEADAQEQESRRARVENVSGIMEAMKKGAGRLHAPKKASFTKK